MTAQTLAFLNGTLLASGQAAGSITPVRMQDIVDTMGARTGRAFVRVTDPEFNADPTGATDSTVAFQNAMGTNCPVLVPSVQPNGSRALYRLSNCIVPNGASLYGMLPAVYGGGGGAYLGFGTATGGFYVPPMIAPLNSTTTRIFNVNAKAGISFNSLLIDCSNVSGFAQGNVGQVCDAISAGGQNINLDSVAIYYAKNGLGGQVATGQTYPNGTWMLNCRNSHFLNCVNGIGGDIVDGHVTDCWFTGCQNGVNGDPVSTTFVNCRFEWCGLLAGGYGWTSGGNGVLTTGGMTHFLGCMFDTCGIAGLNFASGSFDHLVSGCYFQANGNNVSSGTTLAAGSCHINFGGTFAISISGCMSRGNVPRNGVSCPIAFANFVGSAGSNGNIQFVNNDLSGYQGTNNGLLNNGPQSSATLWRTGTAPSSAYVVVHNFGTGTAASDIDLR